MHVGLTCVSNTHYNGSSGKFDLMMAPKPVILFRSQLVNFRFLCLPVQVSCLC